MKHFDGVSHFPESVRMINPVRLPVEDWLGEAGIDCAGCQARRPRKCEVYHFQLHLVWRVIARLQVEFLFLP